MEQSDIIIIGAGVIGLSIASELADKKRTIFVLEKENQYGLGISSRNSEVIHAGIYYPQESLKARLCVSGNSLLYELAKKGAFPALKRGKLIYATTEEEVLELESLYRNGINNGVTGLSLLNKHETLRKEPHLKKVKASLFSPETGVTNAHSLMDYFYHRAREGGAETVCGISIESIEKDTAGFILSIKDTSQEIIKLKTTLLINAAGLASDTIAQMAGIDINKYHYNHYFCKGDYFQVRGECKKVLKHLLYPVPSRKAAGLGIHTTVDLQGELRLGPDAFYIERGQESYTVSENKKGYFHKSISQVMPFIEEDHLSPDFAGIRPKLAADGDPFRDFIIREESDKGLPGLINLIGIESPGLTASPAIAQYVKTILQGKSILSV
ncbi:NAD(P)/FAD-dependent oxidoreductase [Chlamydiota bacterium]